MTAKEFLSQAYRIDKRINTKIDQVASLRDLLYKATSVLSELPPETTGKHSKENIIAKMIDLEIEICTDIDYLIDIKTCVLHSIKSLENIDCQMVLEARYLCFKPWDQIASEMQCGIDNVYRLHKKGLKEIKISEIVQ